MKYLLLILLTSCQFVSKRDQVGLCVYGGLSALKINNNTNKEKALTRKEWVNIVNSVYKDCQDLVSTL